MDPFSSPLWEKGSKITKLDDWSHIYCGGSKTTFKPRFLPSTCHKPIVPTLSLLWLIVVQCSCQDHHHSSPVPPSTDLLVQQKLLTYSKPSSFLGTFQSSQCADEREHTGRKTGTAEARQPLCSISVLIWHNSSGTVLHVPLPSELNFYLINSC